MPSSTSSAPGASTAASSPSSASASPSSTPSASSRRPVKERWDQINQADYLRLMQDRDRLLNLTAASNREYRQQGLQARQQQLQAALTSQPESGATMPEDDMGDIIQDSPVTVNHNYPPAPASPPAPRAPASSLPTTALVATLAALAAGAGVYGLTKGTNPAVPPTTAVIPAGKKPLLDITIPYGVKDGKAYQGTPTITPVP